MSTNVIADVLSAGESEHVEFKAGARDLQSIGATVCAFLNTHGGTIIVGVDSHGKVRPMDDAAKVARAVESFLQDNINPKVLLSVNADRVENGNVVTVEVPGGQDRPYVFNGGIYVRQGESTVAADAEMIRHLVQMRYAEPIRWERLPALGLEMSDLDMTEIQKTIEMAQQARNYKFRNPEDVAQVLEDLALLRSGQLSNAANVLFAKMPRQRLPQTRVRATVFTSDKGGDFADDRLFEGNVFALLEQLFAFVERSFRVGVRFTTGKAQRVDRPEYPFAALREGLINAVAHRDYSAFSGGMSVGIYPSRIEIWNSGRLPEGLTVGDLKRAHPSLPNNPDIAHVLYLRGLIERVGRGTVKIVQECKAAGLPTPQWDASATGVRLILHSARRKSQTGRLNQRQMTLVRRLKPGQVLKPSDYYRETATEVSQRQAQRDLTALEAAGWLRREGDGPSTIYVRTALEATATRS